MLSRIRGGNSGIAEYLESGIKNGRDFTREQLDERVFLDGDLEITNRIINSIEDKGQERYLHITLSFREDDISKEKLAEITATYKYLLMTAYGDEEFNFYAEAHLPKIKSILDKRTGEMVERKPHIHIVIPKTNLLTGRYLDPLGEVNKIIKYHDAIQEHINRKFDLESPKDFVRQGDDYQAEILSRIKGDTYREKHGEIKRDLLAAMEERDIRTIDDFVLLAEQYGEVVRRNQGKSNEYFAIKVVGDSKFTNLKAPVFRQQYIESRIIVLEKPTDKQIKTRLETWQTISSREVKYISNASQKVKNQYRDASNEGKLTFLDELENHYDGKYRAKVKERPSRRADYHQSRFEHPARINAAGLPHGLPSMRSSGMVHREWQWAGTTESLLQNHAHSAVDDSAANQHHGLRRAGYGQRTGQRGIAESNALAQFVSDYIESNSQEEDRVYFYEVRRNLEPTRLLNRLQASHAINVSAYRISYAKDGSARIGVGKENLNVSDFLTKHMHLKWTDAKLILDECYQQQIQDANKSPIYTARRSSRESWSESWRQFIADRARIYESKVTYKEKQADISIAIFERLKREENIKEHGLSGDNRVIYRIAEKYNSIPLLKREEMVMHPIKEFLQSKLTVEDSIIGEESSVSVKENIERSRREKEFIAQTSARLRMNDLIADKSKRGVVVYKSQIDGNPVFTDKGDRIVFNKKDIEEEKIILGLELAIAKYGESLRLTGSEKFKEMVVQIAAEKGMKLQFKPAQYQEMLVAMREQIQNNKAPELDAQSNSVVRDLEGQPPPIQDILSAPHTDNVVLNEQKRQRETQVSIEPIRQIDFSGAGRNEVQEAVAREVETDPSKFFARFAESPLSFGGRFINADTFKETFDQYRESNETRNMFNSPVHNAAAVLAGAQLRRVLQEPQEAGRDEVVLLTGIPGAGKTSSVLNKGKLSPRTHAIYEGQLADKETAIAKVQQVLDAGFKPVIVVVHATPEKALDNTLQRFVEVGRGASMNVMAKIQGGLPEGLAAVYEKFGDAVELRVIDRRNFAEPKVLKGWENISILESEGNHEQIKQRLEQHFKNRKNDLSPDASRQAAGSVPISSRRHSELASGQHEAALDRRDATQGSGQEAGVSDSVPQNNRANIRSGILLRHGIDHYKGDKDEKLSYYVKYRDHEGEKVVWGIDLERAMPESEAQIGQHITIENKGRTAVIVEAAVRDNTGKIVGYENISTHRNEWEVKVDMEHAKAAQENDNKQPSNDLEFD